MVGACVVSRSAVYAIAVVKFVHRFAAVYAGSFFLHVLADAGGVPIAALDTDAMVEYVRETGENRVARVVRESLRTLWNVYCVIPENRVDVCPDFLPPDMLFLSSLQEICYLSVFKGISFL